MVAKVSGFSSKVLHQSLSGIVEEVVIRTRARHVPAIKYSVRGLWIGDRALAVPRAIVGDRTDAALSIVVTPPLPDTVALDSVTVMVSADSTALSSLVDIVIVLLVWPAVKLSVPDDAV